MRSESLTQPRWWPETELSDRGLELAKRVRRRGQRERNLAELKALDAGGLADIGPSEAARARITD